MHKKYPLGIVFAELIVEISKSKFDIKRNNKEDFNYGICRLLQDTWC